MKTNRAIVLSALLVGLGSCASGWASESKNGVPRTTEQLLKAIINQTLPVAQIGMITGALQPTLGTQGGASTAFALYVITQATPVIVSKLVDQRDLSRALNNVFDIAGSVGLVGSGINLYNYWQGKKVEQDNTVNMKKALEAMKKMNKQFAVNADKTNAQIAELRAELKNNSQSSAQSMQAMMQEHVEAFDSKLASLASKLGQPQKALMPEVVPSDSDVAPVLNENVLSEAVIPAALIGKQDQAPEEVSPQHESKSEEVSSSSGENDSQS